MDPVPAPIDGDETSAASVNDPNDAVQISKGASKFHPAAISGIVFAAVAAVLAVGVIVFRRQNIAVAGGSLSSVSSASTSSTAHISPLDSKL